MLHISPLDRPSQIKNENICRDLIGLAVTIYGPLYHAREIATIACLLVVLAKRNQQDLAILVIVFIKTTILLTLLGNEMIKNNERSWYNC